MQSIHSFKVVEASSTTFLLNFLIDYFLLTRCESFVLLLIVMRLMRTNCVVYLAYLYFYTCIVNES